MSELRWCAVPNPPGHRKPEWFRSAALAEDGTVYAPAVVAGNELAVTMAATYDGVSALVSDHHVYLPTDWLAREYPVVADICEKIAQKTREHFA